LNTLWYAVPLSGNVSTVGGFYVLSFNEKHTVPGSSWVLLATRTHDNNTVKWVAGSVILPLPEFRTTNSMEQ
jgi:hypothetical protein